MLVFFGLGFAADGFRSRGDLTSGTDGLVMSFEATFFFVLAAGFLLIPVVSVVADEIVAALRRREEGAIDFNFGAGTDVDVAAGVRSSSMPNIAPRS